MSDYTKHPWQVHYGFSDWGLPCQHDIFVGQHDEPDLLVASVPSITPYCMGASVEDREYAATQKARAQLIVCAPEMAEMLREEFGRQVCVCKLNPLVDGPVPCRTCQKEALLKKAGVL